jgi:tRNA uridine 5-carboxymethylaminomethyl modification enzyme
MFTSRAEYRLTLRADNADQRLTTKGIAIGCVGAERTAHHQGRSAALAEAHALTRSLSITPSQAERQGLSINNDGQRRTAFDLLSYPNVTLVDVCRLWPELQRLAPQIAEQVEIDAKYAVYLERQAADVAAYRRDENLELPEAIDYGALRGLSIELRQKLEVSRPRTIGQAGRIDGMTPACLTLLAAHVRRRGRRPSGARSQHDPTG